jgi:hypothetical protein
MPCASAPPCTSATPARADCTTASTRWWTTASTRRWPGIATCIKVILNADGSVSVWDNGRGIPRRYPCHRGHPAPSSRADRAACRRQIRQRQLQGLGRSARRRRILRQRAERLARSRGPRDGEIYHQKFERGRPVSELETIGKTTEHRHDASRSCRTASIFTTTTTFEWDILANRMRELAFLNKGITITLAREADGREETFHFEGGIMEFVQHLNRSKRPDPSRCRLLREGARQRAGRDRDAVHRHLQRERSPASATTSTRSRAARI